MKLSRKVQALATRINGHQSRIDLLHEIINSLEARKREEQERHRALLPANNAGEIVAQFKGEDTLLLNLLHQQIHSPEFCTCDTHNCRCVGRVVFKIDRHGNILDPATQTPIPAKDAKKLRDKLLNQVRDTDIAPYFFKPDGSLRPEHIWKLSKIKEDK